jgi:hypothetical protein
VPHVSVLHVGGWLVLEFVGSFWVTLDKNEGNQEKLKADSSHRNKAVAPAVPGGNSRSQPKAVI